VDTSALDHYKQLLLAKRRELLPATARALSDAGGADERLGDPTDRATEETQTTLKAHLRESDSHLLRAIEALGRIAHGTFGVCDGCSRPIAEARLKVVPWTHLCHDCNEQRHSWVRYLSCAMLLNAANCGVGGSSSLRVFASIKASRSSSKHTRSRPLNARRAVLLSVASQWRGAYLWELRLYRLWPELACRCVSGRVAGELKWKPIS
jgi:DnaK suppressor protein